MTAATETPSELAVTESMSLAPSAKSASAALETYLSIQRVFDDKMPDAIMTINGKKFRKKSYWRAIATAFRVESRLLSEERVEIDGGWGYLATYRAITSDGRQCDGDGACMASEKVDRYGNATAMQTVHNVRAHAHTRAKNRAIADLVGFGEVSADELGPDAYHDAPPAASEPPNTGPREYAAATTSDPDATLSKDQIKALGIYRANFKASEAAHGDDEKKKFAALNWALDRMGYGRVDEVHADRGEELASLIPEYGKPITSETPPRPEDDGAPF